MAGMFMLTVIILSKGFYLIAIILGLITLGVISYVSVKYSEPYKPEMIRGYSISGINDNITCHAEDFDDIHNVITDKGKVNVLDLVPMRMNLNFHPDMEMSNRQVYYYDPHRQPFCFSEGPKLMLIVDKETDDMQVKCVWYVEVLRPGYRVESYKTFMGAVNMLLSIKRDKLSKRLGDLENPKVVKRFKRRIDSEFSRVWESSENLKKIALVSGITDSTYNRFELIDADRFNLYEFKYFREIQKDEKKRFYGE